MKPGVPQVWYLMTENLGWETGTSIKKKADFVPDGLFQCWFADILWVITCWKMQ